MTSEPVVRLFRCRPSRSEFDSILRDVLIPDLLLLPGLTDVHVGRRGPDSMGDRLIASIWTSEEAMTRSMGTDIEASLFHPEHLGETTDRSLLVLPLAIAIDARRADPPRVMRLLNGRVRDGGLDPYVEDARRGTLHDVTTAYGPLALYLAPIRPDRFVTLSVWTGWEAIEASTGAGTTRPDSTRHAEQLAETSVEHYEIVSR